MGGLFDALRLICYWIVRPVASFTLQSTLLSTLFLYQPLTGSTRQPSTPNDNQVHSQRQQDKNYGKQRSKLLDSITKEFLIVETIRKLSFYVTNLLCNRKYKKKMLKSKHKLEKELDLRKFIHR